MLIVSLNFMFAPFMDFYAVLFENTINVPW